MTALACPTPIREVLEELEAAEAEAVVAGRCVRELLTGARPPDFEILTDASTETVFARFPHAVQIRRGVAMLPTTAGPVDIHSVRGRGGIPAELLGRDLSVHAIGWRRGDGRFLDLAGGRDDLRRGRLRTTRAPDAIFAARPRRALEVARLVAELGFSVDPALEAALPKAVPELADRGGRALRVELDRLVVGPHAASALSLLARTGLLRALLPEADERLPTLIERLPRDLVLRWAACLRGGRTRELLRRYRVPRNRGSTIEALLRQHPITAGNRTEREARARRLARGPAEPYTRLLALARAELAVAEASPADTERLERFAEAVERHRRADEAARRRATLQIDGREVMEHLGCPPGARVGEALRHLAERVAEDPACNDPATLRALLDRWSADA